MPKLTFVIGANATGKTYFIKQNYEGKEVDILNVYDYQQRVYDEEGFGDYIPIDKQFKCLMRANNLLLEDIVAILSQGTERNNHKALTASRNYAEVCSNPSQVWVVYDVEDLMQ